MKKKYLSFLGLLLSLTTLAQTGVNVALPLEDVHVHGTVQVTKDIKVGGSNTTRGDSGTTGQLLQSQGPDQAATWTTVAIPDVPAQSSGSLIAINGKLIIAEEMTYLMTGDFKYEKTFRDPMTINTIGKKIIDTNGNLSNGSFKVAEDGVYLVMINAQITYDTFGTSAYKQPNLIIGIWEDNFVRPDGNKGQWLARVNDSYIPEANDKSAGGYAKYQTYTLTTAIALKKDVKYSFRVLTGFASNSQELTVKALSFGNTGSGPVSYFSVKRLN